MTDGVGLELPLNTTAECGRCGEQARVFLSCFKDGVIPTIKCQQCNIRTMAQYLCSIEYPQQEPGFTGWLTPQHKPRPIQVVHLGDKQTSGHPL